MSNTICHTGPAFSLTGDPYFSGASVSFQVNFNNTADEASVIICEWYLDGLLLINQRLTQFSGQLICGMHEIGVRLLTASGWTGIQTLFFTTCKVPVSSMISGPATVNEGATVTYAVTQTYSDGSNADISSQYVFTSTTGGSFSGNVFTAAVNDTSYNDIPVTITATATPGTPLSKLITVKNTTPVLLVSFSITGPDDIYEGAEANYAVIAGYSDGSQKDVSAEYVFSCPAGTFVGQTLIVPFNNVSGDTRQASITATKNQIAQLTKQITIVDTSSVAGIIVVDLYSNTTLNVIGLINISSNDNLYPSGYTGSNIVPLNSAPSDALIVASDVIRQPVLNWRFEFNLSQLIVANPAVTDIVFYIKGRGASGNSIAGSFSQQSFQAKIVMHGGKGSYFPSVTGGTSIGSPTSFNSYLNDGANGQFDENSLPEILKLTYHVATNTIDHEVGVQAQQWSNTVQSQAFNKNDCASAYAGSSVTYTVPANTYTSVVSQADADNKALNDITNNGQAYANANGSCSVTFSANMAQPNFMVMDVLNYPNLNVVGLIDPVGTDPQLYAYTGQNIIPAGTDHDALILASDMTETAGEASWRFIFNLQKLVADNPGAPELTFYLIGRGNLAKQVTGILTFTKATANDAQMFMGNANFPQITYWNYELPGTYYSHVVAGANGSFMLSDLTNILKVVYNVSTQLITYSTY